MLAFRAPNCEPVKYIIMKPQSPTIVSILNDDVLLHIFYIHRLHIEPQDLLSQIEDDRHRYRHPSRDHLWQRWWYKLAHVSRRWRHVILSAPSLLDLHLVCTTGVPVADMLAHSPPLPLTIVYWLDNHPILKPEDETGALLALSHSDRVRRIALRAPSSELEKLFVAMDGRFPNLELLNIDSWFRSGVTLPRIFGAPNLSYVKVRNVALPIECPLFTTTGLVSLWLQSIPSYGYFHPSIILTSLSLMPQLEALWIMFQDTVPVQDIRDTATISHVTLPNLRKFEFGGVCAYLDGLCARMTAPVLSVFRILFLNHHSFAFPRIASFMQTSEDLQFHAVKLACRYGRVRLHGDPRLITRKYPRALDIIIECNNFHQQISVATQILDALSPVLSVTEKLTLKNYPFPTWFMTRMSRTQWRGLLRSFSNVKELHMETTLRVYNGPSLGHSLCTEEGDLPLLPNLEEVICYKSDDKNAFTPFINEREAVGRPVRLTLQSRCISYQSACYAYSL
jgi:F-box-like